MGSPPALVHAPEAIVWPSPGGSLPQNGHVLSRSGSGPLSQAERRGSRRRRGSNEAAAKRPAAKPPLTSEEARQQAQAEGLTLLVTNSKYNSTTGYFGVSLNKQSGRAKPFHAQVKRGEKQVYLGSFATAEEAALCVARSPEGQEAAKRTESRTAEKRPVAAAVRASEEEARQVAAKVESCRAAEDDVRAMLAMAMEVSEEVSEEVRQHAEAQYDTGGDEAEEVLAVLMEAYDATL